MLVVTAVAGAEANKILAPDAPLNDGRRGRVASWNSCMIDEIMLPGVAATFLVDTLGVVESASDGRRGRAAS